jgi:hypothetical protein
MKDENEFFKRLKEYFLTDTSISSSVKRELFAIVDVDNLHYYYKENINNTFDYTTILQTNPILKFKGQYIHQKMVKEIKNKNSSKKYKIIIPLSTRKIIKKLINEKTNTNAIRKSAINTFIKG